MDELPAGVPWHRSRRAAWLIAAAVLYLAGGVGVTFAFNVPLNQDLAGLDLAAAAPARLAEAREDFEGTWRASPA